MRILACAFVLLATTAARAADDDGAAIRAEQDYITEAQFLQAMNKLKKDHLEKKPHNLYV